jgi:hypothetical protein
MASDSRPERLDDRSYASCSGMVDPAPPFPQPTTWPPTARRCSVSYRLTDQGRAVLEALLKE